MENKPCCEKCKCKPNAHERMCCDDVCKCHTPTVDSSVEGWVMEFHKKFQIVPIAYHKCEGWNDMDSMEIDTAYIDPKPMIAFIKSNRQSLITRIRGEVEEAKREHETQMGEDYVCDDAFDDLLNRIDKIV